ncbi:MAG: hypothetical protein FJ308_13110 [Planctomycetes bacterium]|nr:hypothetical protein [Planctomycetota bacterium]
MQFKLRTIFLVMVLLGLVFVCQRTLEVSWFAPARNGRESQAKFNQLIAGNKWDGFIAPTHYLHNVRILINDIGEAEIRKLYPILHEIYWLKHIDIYAPEISQEMLDELHSEFPECTIDAQIRLP